ncbi:transcriptional regulator VisN [Rhizobium halophytocola]|uniref:DNA-binding CsgD family transcriptional regulator n=1 Tax=Rhizobium halophytocola TaxID=735519 RepID=A0ABS4E5B0_9HYPH|nr:helix-turn-helix domain-containing protein [Rhizobium halophytocola]MBP1853103.1 DNA-binding CsgD family transcriptional regulator [Rhizobium halophytocola]
MDVSFVKETTAPRRPLLYDDQRGLENLTREQLVTRLARASAAESIPMALSALTEYVGASLYLLVRYDLIQEQGLDFAVSSNWPFDMVRRIGQDLALAHVKSSEFERCLAFLQPRFALLPDEADLPEHLSRQYCSLTLNVGRTRLALLLLFPDDVVLSPERLRETGLLAGYCVSQSVSTRQRADREFELTERELECLYWIAEGKTSDEIAMILGISRNTINNYITSVMRKTATKTRSEAIAYAVRNNLV